MPDELTIRAIRARGVELRPDRPVETASGVLRSTPLVLIDLLTEQEVTGRSYLRCYAPEALGPLVALVANLGPLLAGRPAAPAPVAGTLARHFRLLGTPGLVGMALAGIDMALWDARARAAGLPLATVLGGTPGPVPAYASLRSMSPAGAGAEAAAAVERGIGAVKIKVGRADLAADLATIRAVRQAAGDTVALMVDYNQSLTLPEARARIRVLDDEGLYWIEEPLRADDFAGHARLAQVARTPIQLGENCWGPPQVAQSLAAGASDHFMLDVMKLGGVSGWLQAAALVAAAGLPASSHTFPEFSAHLLAVTPTAHWLEYLDHAAPILQAPVSVVKGHVLPLPGPGSGLAWDEAAVAQALVAGA